MASVFLGVVSVPLPDGVEPDIRAFVDWGVMDTSLLLSASVTLKDWFHADPACACICAEAPSSVEAGTTAGWLDVLILVAVGSSSRGRGRRGRIGRLALRQLRVRLYRQRVSPLILQGPQAMWKSKSTYDGIYMPKGSLTYGSPARHI